MQSEKCTPAQESPSLMASPFCAVRTGSERGCLQPQRARKGVGLEPPGGKVACSGVLRLGRAARRTSENLRAIPGGGWYKRDRGL